MDENAVLHSNGVMDGVNDLGEGAKLLFSIVEVNSVVILSDFIE